MKKKDKIQDSPEFKYYKADFENFVKGMEEDKESADLKIPDGWEQDFEKTIDDTLDENERKRKRRIVKRIAGVAAAVVLVVAVGNFTAEQVSGENLLEMFLNQFVIGDTNHTTYGNENEIEFGDDDTPDIQYFSGTTLDEVNEQIREELKYPMFYLEYIPDGFSVVEASYTKMYRIINLKLVKETEYIYIFQQIQVEERASGTMAENSTNIPIVNNYINKIINICKGNRDNSWTFVIDENEIVFTFDAFISEEDCIKIAENVKYY